MRPGLPDLDRGMLVHMLFSVTLPSKPNEALIDKPHHTFISGKLTAFSTVMTG